MNSSINPEKRRSEYQLTADRTVRAGPFHLKRVFYNKYDYIPKYQEEVTMSEHNIPTPHIALQAGEIAETILYRGDPLRAKYIADNFLTDVKQFNATRNMFGYTGSYKGKRVSVMGTGMGVRLSASIPMN